VRNVLSERSNRKCPIAVVCSVLGTLLLIVSTLICIPITIPKVLGYEPYTVISGSMEPAISTGSLVYVKDMEPEEAWVEDVIAYYGGRDQNVVITHRVVENRIKEKEFITKGDANPANDMNAVEYHNFLGRVEYAVPGLGYAAQFLSGRNGKILVISVLGLAIVLHLLSGFLEKRADNCDME